MEKAVLKHAIDPCVRRHHGGVVDGSDGDGDGGRGTVEQAVIDEEREGISPDIVGVGGVEDGAGVGIQAGEDAVGGGVDQGEGDGIAVEIRAGEGDGLGSVLRGGDELVIGDGGVVDGGDRDGDGGRGTVEQAVIDEEGEGVGPDIVGVGGVEDGAGVGIQAGDCLLYTSDAADE